METFDVAKLDTTGEGQQDRVARTVFCPKCGGRANGPYRRSECRGLYYKHCITEGGARQTTWHYVSTRDSPSERREKLVVLVKQRGWRGMRYFAGLLGVSEHTVRRDLDALRKEGRIIHQNYGGYIADPSGILLKEKPWLAWN